MKKLRKPIHAQSRLKIDFPRSSKRKIKIYSRNKEKSASLYRGKVLRAISKALLKDTKRKNWLAFFLIYKLYHTL